MPIIAGFSMRRKKLFVQSVTLLAVCAMGVGQVAAEQPAGPAAAAADLASKAYRLGAGDKLRITVSNEEDVTGEYEVDSSGNVSLKLVGPVSAVGRTLPELSSAIETRLRDGYMLNPRVAIDVLNYRPFYVLGEVNTPGSYPYVSGITVLKAIALAGGFTYRARESKIELIRADDPSKKIIVDQETLLLPGDIVRVNERFF